MEDPPISGDRCRQIGMMLFPLGSNSLLNRNDRYGGTGGPRYVVPFELRNGILVLSNAIFHYRVPIPLQETSGSQSTRGEEFKGMG
jgi:hypothetical protein